MNLLQRAKISIFQQSAESGSTSALMSRTWHGSAAGDGPLWEGRRGSEGEGGGGKAKTKVSVPAGHAVRHLSIYTVSYCGVIF